MIGTRVPLKTGVPPRTSLELWITASFVFMVCIVSVSRPLWDINRQARWQLAQRKSRSLRRCYLGSSGSLFVGKCESVLFQNTVDSLEGHHFWSEKLDANEITFRVEV